jgi:hypothetical protein
MSDEDKPGSGTGKGNAEDFLQIFKRGVQFTEELMEENERLRIRLVRLEEENRTLAKKTIESTSYESLLEQVKILDDERNNLLERFKAVEGESRDFKERYREIEEENNRLANLYIASFQLHSTLDLKEVTRIAFEIIINLVGSMDFGLFIRDATRLVPVVANGRNLSTLPIVTIGKGVPGIAAEEKVLYVAGDEMTIASVQEPRVCIPLVVEDELLGMFVIFSFLAHKPCITDLDRELFNLLGRHAATALCSARLKSDAQGVVHGAASYLKLLNS